MFTIRSESIALIEGMKAALKHLEGVTTKLIIYCDNLHALQLIDQVQSNSPKTKNEDLREEFRKLLKNFNYIETRHVKAHTYNREPRYYMNRWCDINSRRQRKYLGQRPIRNILYGKAGFLEAKQTRP